MVRKKSKAAAKARRAVVVRKKPIVLSSALPGHSMVRNSSLALYWLSMLALVVLGMLLSILIGVFEIVLPGSWVLAIVAALGFFFGFVTHNLVGLVENLEAGHHLFAKVLVPAASILNLLVISAASANLARSFGLPGGQDPVLVTAVYGVALVLPSLASLRGFLAYVRQYLKADRD